MPQNVSRNSIAVGVGRVWKALRLLAMRLSIYPVKFTAAKGRTFEASKRLPFRIG